MRETDPNRRDLHVCLLLALLTLALFIPAAGFGFLMFDDGLHITQNPHVQAGLTWSGIVWAFTQSASIFWHPITWLSHMLDCQLFGMDPRGHHVMNVLFHAANTALLYLVLRRLTGAVGRSAIVAALFAIHPLHVESVAWVAQRKDLLSTLFWLATLWAYLVYAKQPDRRRYLMVCGLFVLGLLSKSMVVTLPFILLLVDVWPLQRLQWKGALENSPGKVPIGSLVREKIPLLVLSVATGLVMLFSAASGNALKTTESLPIGFRLTNIPVSYFRYLIKTIWPEGLSVYYPTPAQWPVALIVASCLAVLGISWLCYDQRKRRPYLLFGWTWYLVTLLPVIGILKVGSHSLADRYTYLPLIGVFIAGVWLAAEFIAKLPRPQPVQFGTAGAVLAACGIVTSLQLPHWRDSLSLFAHSLAVTHDNVMAEYNYAGALVLAGRQPEAIPHYEKVMKMRPGREDVNFHFAEALVAVSRFAEAEQHFVAVLQINPDNLVARGHLANTFYMDGKLADALAQYRVALQMDPRQDGMLNNYALALQANNQPTEAEKVFVAALQLAPNNALTHDNLAKLLLATGRTDEGLRELSVALQLQPDWLEPMLRLAWIAATHPDAKFRRAMIAVQLAQHASELTQFQDAAALDVLGAALAEAGKFKEAVEVTQQAVAVAKAQKEDAVAADMQKRLDLYRAGKPYRDTKSTAVAPKAGAKK